MMPIRGKLSVWARECICHNIRNLSRSSFCKPARQALNRRSHAPPYLGPELHCRNFTTTRSPPRICGTPCSFPEVWVTGRRIDNTACSWLLVLFQHLHQHSLELVLGVLVCIPGSFHVRVKAEETFHDHFSMGRTAG
jgi:hypothetical protein